MTDEERAEVAPGSAAYGNFLGKAESGKPVSVQMAEIGLEVATPLGTVNDIQAELKKDNPSYAKIAGMAGLELLGPTAGAVEMAARAGNKGLLQKILDSFKKIKSTFHLDSKIRYLACKSFKEDLFCFPKV